MKTKKVLYLVTTCFLCILLVLQSGCKKDNPSEEEETSEFILAENTVIIEENTWLNSYISMDSSTHTFTFNGNIEDLNLEVGDIMVSDVGNGMLRKVKKISSDGSKVEVQTEEASIDDAIENGDFDAVVPFDAQDISSVRFFYPGITLDTSNLKENNAKIIFDYNIIFKDVDGDTSTYGDQLRVQGHTELTYNFIAHAKIRKKWGIPVGLNELNLGYISTQTIEINVMGGIGFQKEHPLGEIEFKPFVVYFGTLPVVFKPVLKLIVGVDVSLSAFLTSVVENELEFSAGIEYIRGRDGADWQPYKSFDNTFNYGEPEAGYIGIAEAYIKPEVEIKIYGVSGPYAYAKGYLKAMGQYPEHPRWSLSAGYTIGAGAKVKIWFAEVDQEFPDIFADEVILAQADNPTPTVTTTAITNITQITAVGGGNVTDDGGSTVTARGICWSTSPNPTLNDPHSSNGTGTGSFSSNLEGLSPITSYHVRAFATNEEGTSYGEEVTFTTIDYENGESCPGTPTVTYEGQTYNTVYINGQCWFKENLNVGTMITVDKNQENNGQIEKYCYWNEPDNCQAYGGLYQWNETMQYSTSPGARGICPAGWHIPTDTEWTTLTTFLGGDAIAGGKMKETGTLHWYGPNTGATNESGFTALPGGIGGFGDFWLLTERGLFWSSTEKDTERAWLRILFNNNSSVSRDNEDFEEQKVLGYSARCVKD